MTLATARPLGVLFAPTNIVRKVDMVLAWSLQTKRPQKEQAARAGSSQCQHFIVIPYLIASTASATPLKAFDHAWSGYRSEKISWLAFSATSNERGRMPATGA